MYKRSFRLLSFLLTLVMLLHMLPATAWAEELMASSISASSQAASKEAVIVEEIESGRTEYSKEFKLSNGLHMAAVYNDPVHYEENGQWKDIDNTLKLSSGAYTNTAGVWDVSFPQQLSKNNAVTITKDGYTLSFFMSGQLRSPGNLEVMSGGVSEEVLTANTELAPMETAPISMETLPPTASAETLSIGAETFAVQVSQTSSAQVQKIDLTEEKASAKHPETVSDTLHSRLQYENIYSNTNVVYDLVSNQVKESIIIGSYDAALRGYCYTLNTGSMIPVLTDSGEIHLYDEKQENIVMVMPAPYLLDDALEYCDDVTVNLSGAKGTYILTYTLPKVWLADEARQYPVVLDPIVKAESTLENISDVGIYEKDPYAYNIAVLDVGQRPANGRMRAFVKFFDLPEFSSTDIIVSATFSLHHHSTQAFSAAIAVHKVLGPWEESTVNWENQPAHDPLVVDHHYVEQDEDDFYWDITEIVRDWYENGNNGLMLRASNAVEANTTAASYRHQFYAENYSMYNRPGLTITYRSSIGIEPYYTYATLGAGNAGGVYLSDSTGQLTAVKEVASYASSVNPFSANLIYNSVYCVDDGTALYEPPKEMGLDMSFGAGWTLDAIQKIEPETIGETAYLKYTDGDGTVHYFQKKSGIYYDEDGLGLEIKVESDGSYTMSDSQDNKWYFTNIGNEYGYFMTSSEDNNKNKYEFTYSAGKLTTIVQKNKDQIAITVATLIYSGDNVSKITDAAGNSYNLTYDGNKLTQAYLGTNQCARYAYADYRLTTITDGIRNYSLCFEYDGSKVSSYYEQSSGTTGIRCDISRPSCTQTTYHDYGNDRAKGTTDDLYTHYLMDYAGRTVNVYTTDSTEQNILGASTSVYTDNEGINKTNNRTLRTASIGVAAQKLMLQGNFEATTNSWTYSGSDDASTNPRSGKRSLKATLSSATASASASHSTLSLTKDSTYTLSAYINTADLTSVTGTGVYLKVTESNGTAYTSESLDYITSEDIDEGWVRVSLTFTATVTASATVSIHGTGAVGTFYVDDVQLEKGEAPSNYNMLENSDFQADSTAGGWTLDDTASLATYVGVNSTDASAHSIKFQNAIEDKYAIAYQAVNINESGAQTYVVSGWAKADAVTDNITIRSDPAYDHSKQFGIRATLTYTDGTKNYYYTPFNADVSEWQYASLTVIPESKTKKVDYITISCVYETNANVAYFDNLSMVREVVNSIEYDTNGNPISSESTGTNGQTVSYDKNNNVSKIVTKTGTGSSDKITQTFTYDSTFVHRLVSSSDGTTTQTMTHDAVGNVASTTLKSAKSSSSKVITSSTVYSNSGNLQQTVTGGNGSTTSYEYSGALYKTYGIPSKVTDALGAETNYTIDVFGRYQDVTVDNGAGLSYIYSNSRLHQIKRMDGTAVDLSYQFAYDAFDNMTSLKVGSKTLASYTYAAANGLLTRQTYGNGNYVSYTYDALGRAKTTTYSDGRVLTYRYTGDGQLYSTHDSKTGYTYLYTYDELGRLVASAVKDSSGDLLTTQQTYDANNQLTKQSWQMGDTSYSETYSFNKTNGSLTSMTSGVGHTVSLQYDALQRLDTVTGSGYTKTYSYKDISDTQTTTQVSSISYVTSYVEETFMYRYDEQGNIIKFMDAYSVDIDYVYDSLGQLIEAESDRLYTYTYDKGGNILVATDDGVSHTYTYGDADWADLLTAYDGQAITYDGSGNPLSYYNGTRYTFTWEEGRRLTSAVKNGSNYTYTYDSTGLRTSKTVDGVTHNYLYASGKLLRESYGNTVLDFFYDSNGFPYALNYTVDGTTTTYYYITNLQGDVMYLVTTDGHYAAIYEYDPYGEVLGAGGTMAQINPLRYRGYYYDSELSLYYLQSRYYDPTIGRFINADSYVSTGQGFIGQNMFAYCNNNPINYYDETGRLLQVLRDKTVHDMVLTIICGHNSALRMTETCVYYNRKNFWGGLGYCDLYNVETGEVWELKKDSNSISCTTAAAQTQLSGYISGRLKHHPDLELKLPYQTIVKEGTFEFTDGLYIYHVTYWYEGNGILRYKYTYTETDKAKVLAFAYAAALALAQAYYNSQAEEYGFPLIPIN